MSKSSGGGDQTVTTKPFSEVQRKSLNQGWAMAPEILNNPLQYFPDSTVAGFGDPTKAALSGIVQQGMSGPGVGAAVNANNATLNGAYLGQNPYLQGAIEAAQRPTMQAFQTAVTPGIDSGFARAGRYGSGAHANATGQANEALARGLADSANSFSFGDYGRERGEMTRAAALAPSLDSASYTGLNAALGAGQMTDQMSQAQLNDQVARFNFGQDEQYNRLARYMPLVSGNIGSVQTSPGQQTYTNPAAGGLGGALAGAQLGSAVPGIGTGIGAGVGGLIGLLSAFR